MFSDVLIILFALTSCFNGWSRGLSRSLRGLIALAIAVFAAPYAYPALAAWLYHRIDIDAAQASTIAYVVSLFALLAIATAILVQIFNSYWEDSPWLIDRLGGFIYGGFKTALIVVLAVMISNVPVQLPVAPYGRMKISNLTESSKFFLPKALPWSEKLAYSEFSKYFIAAHVHSDNF